MQKLKLDQPLYNYFLYSKHLNFIAKRNLTALSNERITKEKVVIPKAIKRGPTDILKALSSTVKMDYSGPSYKYVDDPYLTPTNSVDKRSFSYSKESGRKAAQYFIDMYPEYFQRDISEPKVEAFTYKEVYDDSMELEELDLHKCISRSDVSNSIVCYSSLRKQDKEISQDVLYDLLDLVCFYNCENLPDRYVEEEWFKNTRRSMVESNTWKDNGFAEQLFESIEPKCDRVYASLIQGMAKYMQCERAFLFYNQALSLNYKLNVETYNSLIMASFNLRQTNDQRWETIMELLQTMRDNEIKPNLQTLNTVLKQISKYKFWNLNFDVSKKVFNEFAFKFGIAPSLATYYHLLNIFYRSRNSRSGLIYEIMDKIHRNTFEVSDVDDVHFFSQAMEVSLNLNDIQLAYKVHKFAENNRKLIGIGFHQNIYYNKYLKLLCSSETIENFMIEYNKYVPHIYTPNIDLMDQILKTIKIYKAFNYIPQLWHDLLLFAYSNRIELLQELLSAMNEIKKEDPLISTFNDLVLDIFQKTNTRIAKYAEQRYNNQFDWNAKSLSYCIQILVKADNLDSAFEVLKKLDSLKDKLLDEPDSQALIDFCCSTIADRKFEYTLFCLKYCKDVDKIDVLEAVKKETQNIDFPTEKLKNLFEQFLNI